jgi:hypothetical protein
MQLHDICGAPYGLQSGTEAAPQALLQSRPAITSSDRDRLSLIKLDRTKLKLDQTPRESGVYMAHCRI